jgi:hypothetical protein
MRRYVVGFVGLIVLAVFGATSVAQSAHRASTTTATTTLRVAVLSTTCRGGDTPRPLGCTWVTVSTWHSSAGVGGVARADNKLTGHPSPNTYTERTTSKNYADQGTFTITTTGQWTVHPRQNRKTFSLKGHLTGGTGAFRGISGTTKCSGSRAPVVHAMPVPPENLTCTVESTLP